MKKIILLLLFCLLLCSFTACASTKPADGGDDGNSAIEVYADLVDLLRAELEALKARGEGANALLRAERELEKIKKKLDALCAELPEEISERPSK